MQARAIEFVQLGKQATEILYMHSPVGSQRDRHTLSFVCDTYSYRQCLNSYKYLFLFLLTVIPIK
jgi:hypothetical protein